MIATDEDVVSYAELSDEAKEKARQWWSDCETQVWTPAWDCHITPLGHMGIDVDYTCAGLKTARFDVNYSVGDRGSFANFEGHWIASMCDMSKLMEECPTDTELHSIGARLSVLALQWPDSRTSIRRLSREGSMCCAITTNSPLTDDWAADDDYTALNTELEAVMKDVGNWLKDALEADYEDCFDTERIEENIMANEYKFTRDGDVI